MTHTSETPTDSRRGSPKPIVSNGTMSRPPPNPSSDPNNPAATPPASIRSPTSTACCSRRRSGGQRPRRDRGPERTHWKVRERGPQVATPAGRISGDYRVGPVRAGDVLERREGGRRDGRA